MSKYSFKLAGWLFVACLGMLGCEKPADTGQEKASGQAQNVSRVAALPYYGDASFTPRWLKPGDPALESLHRIPPFELTNQMGERVTEKMVDGKIYVVDFFFTSCPGICPKMTANMQVLQEAFQEDESVLLLSHSVTPDRDSVPVLRAYAEEHAAIPGKWHLLTGDRSQIYRLGRQAYFVEEDLGLQKSEYEFLHTENFVLIDPNRHIRGIYNGLNSSSVQQLIADVRLLQQEAGP